MQPQLGVAISTRTLDLHSDYWNYELVIPNSLGYSFVRELVMLINVYLIC